MNIPRHREELLLSFMNSLKMDKESGLERKYCLLCKVEVFPQIKHIVLFLVMGIKQSKSDSCGGEEDFLLTPALLPVLPALIAIN